MASGASTIRAIGEMQLAALRLGFSSGGAMSGIGGLYSPSGVSSTGASALFSQAVENRKSFNNTELALRQKADALVNAVSSFKSAPTFAESSDPDAVAATTLANAGTGTYNVEVDALAQSRRIAGNALAAGDAAAISTTGGYGQLEITAGGKTEYVTYRFRGGETNEQALNTIASAVNAKKAGVTASVLKEGGTARLIFEGRTGAANSFTVKDSTGNAAAVTGVNNPLNVTREAGDAEFSVNGASFVSDTNTPTLAASGLKLNLKETTTGAVKIDVKTNEVEVEKLEAAARGFVAQYNKTVGDLKKNSNVNAQQSAAMLEGTLRSGASALRNIGIDVSAGGTLKINESRFSGALENRAGAVAETFDGATRLSTRVRSETERALNQSLSTPSAGLPNINFSRLGGLMNSGDMLALNSSLLYKRYL